MSNTVFYILEIILSLVGIGLILAQPHPEEGSSFFATSLQNFKFQNTRDKTLFWATVVVIGLFLIVLYLHNTVGN